MFDDLLLEEVTKKRLSWYVSEKQERCTNLLLLGEKGIGKYQIAKEIASWLLRIPRGMPNHLSLDFFEAEECGGGTRKEQMEAMMEFISYAPVRASKRVILIDDADDVEQNMLLKPMESQAHTCIFILVAHSSLLSTIQSRSVLLPVVTPSEENMELFLKAHEEVYDPVLVAASGGKVGYYRKFQERADYRDHLHRFLKTFNEMKDARDLLEISGALREKDSQYLFLQFDKDELAGFLNLLRTIFRWNLTCLSGCTKEPPFPLRTDMQDMYQIQQTVQILEVLKQQEQMIKVKGRYSKNNFFDLLISLITERRIV